jgi:hypothetical protein
MTQEKAAGEFSGTGPERLWSRRGTGGDPAATGSGVPLVEI